MIPRLEWPEELPEHTQEALQSFFDLELKPEDRDTCVLFMARKIQELVELANESRRLHCEHLAVETERVALGMLALVRLMSPENPLVLAPATIPTTTEGGSVTGGGL